MSAVVISNNTATLWQTLFAMSAVITSVIAGFGWLNRKLAKKSDIQKLSEELAEVKDGNTKENTRIIVRLDRHIEFGTHARNTTRSPLDGLSDE